MRVGITYDLRDEYIALGYTEEAAAEFDRADTIESVEAALRAIGCETQRIGHVRALVGRLAAGDRWDLVFNFAEGVRGYGRESQVPALLDAYAIPYTFSDPMVLAISLHKGMAKRVLRDCGVPTAPFAIVEAQDDLDAVNLPYPLFAKPIAEGTGKGISPRSVLRTPEDLRAVCASLLAEHQQPVLVETFLPGREFTVGVVGAGNHAEAVPAVLEIILRSEAEANVYSLTNKERCEELVEYRTVSGALADECRTLAVRAWRALGCVDAGRVDLRADDQGRLMVMELNPLAGLHPEHSDLPMVWAASGRQYVDLIGRIVLEACKRNGLHPPTGAKVAGAR
jgi:D-alanine-D-alanine ligase